MIYFRSTGTSGGLLFTRTRSAFLRDRASEMLQAMSLADSAVTGGSEDASETLRRLAAAVLAVVGDRWVAECRDARVRQLVLVADGSEHAPVEDASFDQLCSDVLRLRFPAETAREAESPAWGTPRD